LKWFKHISDSLDDPFISDLMAEFGSDGYVAFFGILEIYAREFSVENGWKLEISWHNLKKKTGISRKNMEEILKKIWKWEIAQGEQSVTIFIPKFNELLSDGTVKKLREIEQKNRKVSGEYPEAKRIRDVDEDIYISQAKEILSYFNEVSNSRFRDFSFIVPRLKDGATVSECKRVIDVKAADPYFKENRRYLCPQTIFRKSHWDKYIQETELMKEKFVG